MGYAVTGEYVEHESGGKSADHRKQLAQVFADASRRDFDMLLVWALDRFSREGMAATVVYLQRLSSYGVGFHSYSEERLSTDNELVRNILLATLASLAKLEREKISQRTKAGLKGRIPTRALNSRRCGHLRDNVDGEELCFSRLEELPRGAVAVDEPLLDGDIAQRPRRPRLKF